MARQSLRRRFLVSSVTSTIATLILFALATVVATLIDHEAEQDILKGSESYHTEVAEVVLGAMAIAAPLGIAAAVVMAVVVGLRVNDLQQPHYMVVLAAPQNAAPGWVLKMTGATTLRLEPLVATAVPAQRALQLWTKADDWSGPVSLGLVKPGETVEVKLDKLPKIVPNQLFEITLEPQAGSPIGKPTGPILFIGRAVVI